jgi:hypothetical protein
MATEGYAKIRKNLREDPIIQNSLNYRSPPPEHPPPAQQMKRNNEGNVKKY